jgi:hypothetical protein
MPGGAAEQPLQQSVFRRIQHSIRAEFFNILNKANFSRRLITEVFDKIGHPSQEQDSSLPANHLPTDSICAENDLVLWAVCLCKPFADTSRNICRKMREFAKASEGNVAPTLCLAHPGSENKFKIWNRAGRVRATGLSAGALHAAC